jgi:hypothetical protein
MSGFGHDPEVPGGYQDADLEQSELERKARELPPLRRARIRNADPDTVAAYLPGNYQVVGGSATFDPTVSGAPVEEGVLIEGRDDAGWTLDEYVLPRLASGNMFGEEVTDE